MRIYTLNSQRLTYIRFTYCLTKELQLRLIYKKKLEIYKIVPSLLNNILQKLYFNPTKMLDLIINLKALNILF